MGGVAPSPSTKLKPSICVCPDNGLFRIRYTPFLQLGHDGWGVDGRTQGEHQRRMAVNGSKMDARGADAPLSDGSIDVGDDDGLTCGFAPNQRPVLDSQHPTEATALLAPDTSITSTNTMGIKSRTALAALGIVASASAVVSTSSLPSSQTACVDSSETFDAVTSSLMNVYCRGPLLDAVQHAELFNDSKHFVDMPIKSNSSAVQVLTEFERDVLPSLPSLNYATLQPTLRAFVSKHFDEPGSELRKIVLSDFSETVVPPRIASIKNEVHRTWAMGLHSLWKELGRSPSRDVVSSYLHPAPLASLGDSDASTVIVVPGGRFRESYYWDSYWIVEGLLVSNMKDTARRVVRNLLEYVGQYGFVPNGGRIYYLTRSQPPMLSDMVRLVATKGDASTRQSKVDWDIEYLRAVVPLLETEYTFWMTSHAVDVTKNGVTYKLNKYTADANAPRPESYREDVRLAQTAFPENKSRQNEFYDDIIAAAESGWDFSSRWFHDHKTLATIVTRDVIPVDLNVIMHRVESNLATFYDALGDRSAAKRFQDAAATRSRAIDAVFWDEKSSSWRDYSFSSGSLSPVVSVSNYSPLWGRAFANDDRDRLNRVVSSLRTSGLIQVAGVQTTTKSTGEQWDAPNAWPPLQDILVEGLQSVKTKEADDLAKELVQTWVDTSLAAWNSTGLMFEKYNATVVGGLGSGGEYTPQFGFGWTNGVILKFLTSFQEVL